MQGLIASYPALDKPFGGIWRRYRRQTAEDDSKRRLVDRVRLARHVHVTIALLRVLRVGEGEAVLHVEAATRVEAVCEPLVAVVFPAVVVIGRRVPAAQQQAMCVCVCQRVRVKGIVQCRSRAVCVSESDGHCVVETRAERESAVSEVKGIV